MNFLKIRVHFVLLTVLAEVSMVPFLANVLYVFEILSALSFTSSYLFYKKSFITAIWALFLYTIFLVEILTIYSLIPEKINNAFYSYFTIFQFLFYMINIIVQLLISYHKKVASMLAISALVVFIAERIVYLHVPNYYSIYGLSYSAIVIVFSALLLLYTLITNNANAFRYPFLWICIGLLLYYSGSTTITILYNVMKYKYLHLLQKVFPIYYVFSISMYICFIISAYMYSKHEKK